MPDLHYPLHDKEQVITGRGSLLLSGKRNVFVSAVLASQPVGLTEVDDGIWKVTFMEYDLGYFDDESCHFTPLEASSKEKRPLSEEGSVTYVSGKNCYPCLRLHRFLQAERFMGSMEWQKWIVSFWYF